MNLNTKWEKEISQKDPIRDSKWVKKYEIIIWEHYDSDLGPQDFIFSVQHYYKER